MLSSVPIQEAPPPVLSHHPTMLVNPEVQEVSVKISQIAPGPISRQAEEKGRASDIIKKLEVEAEDVSGEVSNVAKVVSLKLGDKPLVDTKKIKEEVEKEVALEHKKELRDAARAETMNKLKAGLWLGAAVLCFIIALAVIGASAYASIPIIIGIQLLCMAHGHFEKSFHLQEQSLGLHEHEGLRRQASLDNRYSDFINQRIDSKKYYIGTQKNSDLDDPDKKEKLLYRMINDPVLYKQYREAHNNVKLEGEREKNKESLDWRLEHVYGLKIRELYQEEELKPVQRQIEEEVGVKDINDQTEEMMYKMGKGGFPPELIKDTCREQGYKDVLFLSEQDFAKLKNGTLEDLKPVAYKDINKLLNPLMVGFIDNNNKWELHPHVTRYL
jgi:hypothetical protein